MNALPPRPPAELVLRDRTLTWARPLLMGIVNANPDSFSDPGPRPLREVVKRATELVAAGAAVIDVGAQSGITARPPVDSAAEAAMVVPAVEAIRRECPDTIVSVDTFKPAVVEAVLQSGAHLINDVSGLRDRAAARLCAAYGAGLVVMHTAAPPLTRLQDPCRYEDVAAEVRSFLAGRVDVALDEGVGPRSIVVDPGVDFTKTPAQTVELLRRMDRIVDLGRPVLLALSRKDFIGALTGRRPVERGAGTLGAIAALRSVPGQILRVHEVAAASDFLTVFDTLAGDGALAGVAGDAVLPEHLRHERN